MHEQLTSHWKLRIIPRGLVCSREGRPAIMQHRDKIVDAGGGIELTSHALVIDIPLDTQDNS